MSERLVRAPIPRVDFEEGVEERLGAIGFDEKLCSSILVGEGLSYEDIVGLNINFRLSAERMSRLANLYWKRHLGYYQKGKIVINVSSISEHCPETDKAINLCNETLAHELGHAVDDFRGNLKRPTLSLVAMMGSWATCTIAPAAGLYAETGNVACSAALGGLSFIGSPTLIGTALKQLDKRQLTEYGRNERFANDFAARILEAYPPILTAID